MSAFLQRVAADLFRYYVARCVWCGDFRFSRSDGARWEYTTHADGEPRWICPECRHP